MLDLKTLLRDESSLSVGKLCQLAILRSIHGEDGQALAEQILPLYLFPSLWSRENEYNKEEALTSINLLLQAFGKDPFYKSVSSQKLDVSLPSFQENNAASTKAKLFTFGEKIKSAFVNHGESVALGALNCGSIEIPAFGPQLHPLNDPQLFGCHRTDTQWSAVSALREIWFEYHCSQNGFETRFFGITREATIYFVFYVKAELAIIGTNSFLPKSLQRYHSHVEKITFHSQGNSLSIESPTHTKMQLIPLAGSGCFWESDFLVAYEIPLHDSKVTFLFS